MIPEIVYLKVDLPLAATQCPIILVPTRLSDFLQSCIQPLLGIMQLVFIRSFHMIMGYYMFQMRSDIISLHVSAMKLLNSQMVYSTMLKNMTQCYWVIGPKISHIIYDYYKTNINLIFCIILSITWYHQLTDINFSDASYYVLKSYCVVSIYAMPSTSSWQNNHYSRKTSRFIVMAKKSWWISCSVANYWGMIHGTSAWFTMEATGKHGPGKIQQSPVITWSFFSRTLIMDTHHMWTAITRYGMSQCVFPYYWPKSK